MQQKPMPFALEGFCPPFQVAGDRSDLRLELLNPADAPEIAKALSLIDPWRRLGIPAERLLAGLALSVPKTPSRHAFVLKSRAQPAGVAVLDDHWLRGPYVRFFAILPGHERQGLGSALLTWIIREASREADNLWLCASAFNSPALRLYERHGFLKVAVLDDLLRPGDDEILMRCRLDQSRA